MIQTNTNVNRFGNHGARFAAYGGVLKVWHWNFGCTFFSLFNPRSAERLLASSLSLSIADALFPTSKQVWNERANTNMHTHTNTLVQCTVIVPQSISPRITSNTECYEIRFALRNAETAAAAANNRKCEETATCWIFILQFK